MSVINSSNIIGSGTQNVVLETAGRVYIKVKDKYYELDFRNQNKRSSGTTIVNNTTKEESDLDMSDYVTKEDLASTLVDYVTKRSWADVKETQKLLEESLLDGFTEHINPITLNTMQVIVGSAQLQFDFITNLTNDTTIPLHVYLDDIGRLVCPKGVIKHYTLDGPDAVQPNKELKQYCRWTIENLENAEEDDLNTYLDLAVDEQAYYLYIVANKISFTQADVDAPDDEATKKGVYAKTGTAYFMISETAFELEPESDPNNYYLLYGIVNSKSNDTRSISTMNGFTEILPGQVTAYIFKNKEGDQYMDFLNKAFHIGDASEVLNGTYMHWDTENGLLIKGNVAVTTGPIKDELDRLESLIGTTWFASNAPTAQTIPHPLKGETESNWPVSLWTTDELKQSHTGNRYYVDNDTEDKVYVYVYNNGDYYWEEDNNSDYEYLIKAIKGKTDLQGGLIMTNLLQLGFSYGNTSDIDDYYAKFSVMSGINGVCTKTNEQGYLSYKDIAAWYGGAKRDLELDKGEDHYDSFFACDPSGNYVKFVFSSHEAGEAYYKWKMVDQEYYVYLLNNPPELGDDIYFYDSETQQYSISTWSLVHYSPGYASSIFRMDGTGYLAKGNISWNTNGELELQNIKVTNSANIGPLVVDNDSVYVMNESREIFRVDKNACNIFGSLRAQSLGYDDNATVEILDSSGTKIADIGSQPLSTAAVPSYIRKREGTTFVYTKGSIMCGTVTVPENWYFQVLENYSCYNNNEVYTITDLNIKYDFARISKTIKTHIYLRDYNVFDKTLNIIELHNKEYKPSTKTIKETITVQELKTNGIALQPFHIYQLVIYVEPGGQVKSSIASDSHIGISITGGDCVAEITKASGSLDLGTFIRPNGISSAFGKKAMFQWLGAMHNDSSWADYRKEGGTFKVVLPATHGGDSADSEVGLLINGYYDASARTGDSGFFIKVGDGTGWYKLSIENGYVKATQN